MAGTNPFQLQVVDRADRNQAIKQTFDQFVIFFPVGKGVVTAETMALLNSTTGGFLSKTFGNAKQFITTCLVPPSVAVTVNLANANPLTPIPTQIEKRLEKGGLTRELVIDILKSPDGAPLLADAFPPPAIADGGAAAPAIPAPPAAAAGVAAAGGGGARADEADAPDAPFTDMTGYFHRLAGLFIQLQTDLGDPAEASRAEYRELPDYEAFKDRLFTRSIDVHAALICAQMIDLLSNGHSREVVQSGLKKCMACMTDYIQKGLVLTSFDESEYDDVTLISNGHLYGCISYLSQMVDGLNDFNLPDLSGVLTTAFTELHRVIPDMNTFLWGLVIGGQKPPTLETMIDKLAVLPKNKDGLIRASGNTALKPLMAEVFRGEPRTYSDVQVERFITFCDIFSSGRTFVDANAYHRARASGDTARSDALRASFSAIKRLDTDAVHLSACGARDRFSDGETLVVNYSYGPEMTSEEAIKSMDRLTASFVLLRDRLVSALLGGTAGVAVTVLGELGAATAWRLNIKADAQFLAETIRLTQDVLKAMKPYIAAFVTEHHGPSLSSGTSLTAEDKKKLVRFSRSHSLLNIAEILRRLDALQNCVLQIEAALTLERFLARAAVTQERVNQGRDVMNLVQDRPGVEDRLVDARVFEVGLSVLEAERNACQRLADRRSEAASIRLGLLRDKTNKRLAPLIELSDRMRVAYQRFLAFSDQVMTPFLENCGLGVEETDVLIDAFTDSLRATAASKPDGTVEVDQTSVYPGDEEVFSKMSALLSELEPPALPSLRAEGAAASSAGTHSSLSSPPALVPVGRAPGSPSDSVVFGPTSGAHPGDDAPNELIRVRVPKARAHGDRARGVVYDTYDLPRNYFEPGQGGDGYKKPDQWPPAPRADGELPIIGLVLKPVSSAPAVAP